METEPFSIMAGLGWDLQSNISPAEVGLEFALLALLLFSSAFFSGSEAAFLSLTSADKNKIMSRKDKIGAYARLLFSRPEKLIATIVIANNLINITIVVLSTYLFILLFGATLTSAWMLIFAIVAISLSLLLFVEIAPKSYANRLSYKYVQKACKPVWFASKLLSPMSEILLSSSKSITSSFSQHTQDLSVDELSNALDLSSEQLTEDKQILKGIVTFGNISVREIMRPRIDVIAIDINTPFSKLNTIIIESGYSRIPVYDKNFDNIKGILFIKDLLPHIGKPNSFRWQSLIRPPYFVPESKKIDDLLHDFQTNKVHMAIVVDEFGGTSGILTMEDILEEIVGEISDESDNEEPEFIRLDRNCFIIEGKLSLNEFFRITETQEEELQDFRGDAETLAGLILEIKGEIPAKLEKISVGRFTFVIEAVDNRRIKKIKVLISR